MELTLSTTPGAGPGPSLRLSARFSLSRISRRPGLIFMAGMMRFELSLLSKWQPCSCRGCIRAREGVWICGFYFADRLSFETDRLFYLPREDREQYFLSIFIAIIC